jgi:hypothetical protein
MKQCAFCPAEAVKRGGEHIWDDWLNRALPTKKFRVKQRLSPADPFREYDAAILKEKLPTVCEKCNNTWMSDITERVKQNFQDAIINGATLALPARDIALLSAFTFMKAVVAGHAIPGAEPFFTRAARERFRQSLAVPPHVQMWIAAYQGRYRYSGKCNAGILVATDDGPYEGIEFFAFTYVVGHLVLQLLAPRWKDVRHRASHLPIPDPLPNWNTAVIGFWPDDGAPGSWPPPKYIGDDTIEQFIDRFKRQIRLRAA